MGSENQGSKFKESEAQKTQTKTKIWNLENNSIRESSTTDNKNPWNSQ